MVIILVLYAVLVWLVFSKLKLVRWGWGSGFVTGMIGLAILGVFMALFNSLTPSGRIAVLGRVVDVTPNVTGQVIAIPVETNVLVKAGSVLFQIDPEPYRFKVRQLAAALAEAKQKVEQLKASVDVAVADVESLRVQWERADKRREDLEQLGSRQATSQFNVQDAIAQANALAAQIEAAKAREASARLAATSEIDGENTTVAQLKAQLDNAEWELKQTTILAPEDGYVTLMALAIGDRVSPSRGVMSFVGADGMVIVGMFQQNGLQTIKPGTSASLRSPTNLARSTKPRSQTSRAASAKASSPFPVRSRVWAPAASRLSIRLDMPANIDRDLIRPGMSGSATVFSPNAGAIDVLGSILLWVSAYMAYL